MIHYCDEFPSFLSISELSSNYSNVPSHGRVGRPKMSINLSIDTKYNWQALVVERPWRKFGRNVRWDWSSESSAWMSHVVVQFSPVFLIMKVQPSYKAYPRNKWNIRRNPSIWKRFVNNTLHQDYYLMCWDKRKCKPCNAKRDSRGRSVQSFQFCLWKMMLQMMPLTMFLMKKY